MSWLSGEAEMIAGASRRIIRLGCSAQTGGEMPRDALDLLAFLSPDRHIAAPASL